MPLFPAKFVILFVVITLVLMIIAGVIIFFILKKILAPGQKKQMPLLPVVNGKRPVLGNNCFLAPNATLAGDVATGDDCSFWFNSVVRGDVNFIKMGNKVNVQDGAIIHCTYQKNPTIIGNNVSIGHRAIVHGCTVHDNVLIGMGAIVMDKSVVESNTIIAAGAVVTEGTVVEANSIYAGIPAKKIKNIQDSNNQDAIARIADNYVKYACWFKTS